MNTIESLNVDVTAFFPENFRRKEVNERFVQEMMEFALECDNWVQGDANKFEPDYLCDGVPFEFTIASNRKKYGNFIELFYSGIYESDDVEDDVHQYIRESISAKLKKSYSVSNVHLCVLCLLNMTEWVLGEYGSVTHDLYENFTNVILSEIKEKCLDSNKFSNVFLIFPDIMATWWVWDVQKNHKTSIKLSEEAMWSRKYPFWVCNGRYEELLLKMRGGEKT